jgi:exonuclease SbcC
MQILAIDLENIKSYERAHIDFTHGVNAIVGHNGAGKSTILEAIGFALFDALDYKQSDFIRAGAKNGAITVSILSSLDDRRYDIVRRLGTGSGYFVHDVGLQMRICEGKPDAQAFLRQHLGVEVGTDLSALFHDAVGVPQGTFTAIFLANQSQRKPVFDRLLQVDEYQKASDQLREAVRLLRDRRAEIAVEIGGLEGQLQRLPVLEQSVAERTLTIHAAQTQQAQAQAELAETERSRSQLDAVQQQVALLQSSHNSALLAAQAAEHALTTARRSLAEAEEAHAAVQHNLPGYRAFLAAQEQQKFLDGRQRERQQIEQRRAAADKQLALHQAQHTTLRNELDLALAARQAAEELQPAVAEQERLDTELTAARSQFARFEEAGRAAVDARKQTNARRQHLDQIKTQRALAQTLDSERTTVQAQLGAIRTGIEGLRDQFSRCKAEGEALKEQTKMLETSGTAVCPVCKQPLSPQHRSEVVALNRTRLDKLRQECILVQKSVKSEETRLQEQEQALQRTEEKLRSLPRAEEVSKAERDVEAAEQSLREAEQRVASLAEAPVQIEALTRQLEALGNPRRQYTVAAERASRCAELETRLATTGRQLAAAQLEVDRLVDSLRPFTTLDAELESVAAEVQCHSAAYQAVLANRKLADTLDARRVDVAHYEQDLERAHAESTAAAAQLAQASARFDAAAYTRLITVEQQLRSQLGALRAQLELMAKTQIAEESELSSLRQVVAGLEDAQQRQGRLAVQEEALDTIRTLLRQAGPHITSALIRRIGDGARQVFCEIMQDYTRHLSWNEDYSVSLDVDGHERQFAQLSGGEQMSAALAVRLALLREMSNIDVAFFDEPTANLDEERRESLARQILQVRGFRQLFVISHDDTFEQATQNLVRIRRVNGVSQVEYG